MNNVNRLSPVNLQLSAIRRRIIFTLRYPLFILRLFILLALTANLQDGWYEDEFVIALSNFIRDKRRNSGGSLETLLSVKYRGTKTKIVLLLDRRTKRSELKDFPGSRSLNRYNYIYNFNVPVMLENFDDVGRRSISHVNVDSLAVNTPLKSLIILVHQTQPNSRMDVYVDCVYEGSIPLKRTFRDIAETEDSFVEVVSFYYPQNIFRNSLSSNQSQTYYPALNSHFPRN